MNTEIKPPDPIQIAFENAKASGLTLADRYIRMVASIQVHLSSNRFSEVTKAQIEARAIQFINDVMKSDCIARSDVDTYRQLANSFITDLGKLEHPPQPQLPSWDEHLAHWTRNGWTSQDLSMDRLWMFFPDGRATTDRIISTTDESITMASGKIISRTELRLPPITRRVARFETGPQAIIGKPTAKNSVRD